MSLVHEISEPVVECPYNKFHRIAKSRIQKHIVKCEKNFPEGFLEICPYNAAHRMFKHEMQNHIDKCPMRALIQPELYQCIKNHGSMMSQSISGMERLDDAGESWDEVTASDKTSTANGSIFDRSDTPGAIAPPKKCYIQHLRCKDVQSNKIAPNLSSDSLRPPRGYSIAMLVLGSEKSDCEDTESLTSSMGIGRGSANHLELLKKNALREKGVGRRANTASIPTKVGDNARYGKKGLASRSYSEAIVSPDSDNSDTEDLESITSSMCIEQRVPKTEGEQFNIRRERSDSVLSLDQSSIDMIYGSKLQVPRGYPRAEIALDSENSYAEDSESITSSMCLGRGNGGARQRLT